MFLRMKIDNLCMCQHNFRGPVAKALSQGSLGKWQSRKQRGFQRVVMVVVQNHYTRSSKSAFNIKIIPVALEVELRPRHCFGVRKGGKQRAEFTASQHAQVIGKDQYCRCRDRQLCCIFLRPQSSMLAGTAFHRLSGSLSCQRQSWIGCPISKSAFASSLRSLQKKLLQPVQHMQESVPLLLADSGTLLCRPC